MSSATPSISDTIAQLNTARNLALGDATYYSQIVPSVLPLIGANAHLDLRRWGADFLAETFASPLLSDDAKQQLSLRVLPVLKEYLDKAGEDVGVVKSVVQAATSIYPLIFRHVINNPNDSPTWQTMAAIKSSILRRMDTSPAGVRICCVKFVQRVVQTQTPGLIADPRRPEQNEISLALVPRDHPLIPPTNLEAEASGLLDRLLGILQENISDALLVDATLNSLGNLIRLRPSIANKVVSTILNFNPLKPANTPMTPKTRVMIKSMERTTKALLLNIIKKAPQHPLAGRIQQYLERLHQSRSEIFDEINRKRPAPSELPDGVDQAKRQRLGEDVSTTPTPRPTAPPLPPGTVSFAQLFTLTEDQGSKNFDVQAIPIDLVVRILVPMISQIDKEQMDNAINAVRFRYLSLSKPKPQTALDAASSATGRPPDADEDEDYEPDYQPTEDAEQIINKMDNEPPDSFAPQRPPEVALGPFKIPQPPPLTEMEVIEHGKATVNRVFGMIDALEETSVAKAHKAGFNRLAASSYDRDAWVTVISRLATRASAGLDDGAHPIKSENHNGTNSISRTGFSIPNIIREALNMYVVQDFRRRIGVAISWLSEEWYNDRIRSRFEDEEEEGRPVRHYETWLLRLLDQIVPYLDAKDKFLIRFLSEIPAIDAEVLERVKKLARDPERVGLAVSTIQYMLVMRPPAREMCINALEDLWRNYDDAKPSAAKLLAKWRPHVLQQEATDGRNGEVKAE